MLSFFIIIIQFLLIWLFLKRFRLLIHMLLNPLFRSGLRTWLSFCSATCDTAHQSTTKRSWFHRRIRVRRGISLFQQVFFLTLAVRFLQLSFLSGVALIQRLNYLRVFFSWGIIKLLMLFRSSVGWFFTWTCGLVTLAVITTGFLPSLFPVGLFSSFSVITVDIWVVPGFRISGSAGSIGLNLLKNFNVFEIKNCTLRRLSTSR